MNNRLLQIINRLELSPKDKKDLAYYIDEYNANITEVTYAELVAFRDNGELIAGMQYRITDYVTTTAQENTRSAGHQFDIIVTADSNNTLNEVARACLHEGDTYFSEAGANLAAWQIWYSLDNDTKRFAWARIPLYSPVANNKMMIINYGGETYIYVRDSSFDSAGKCAWLYAGDGDNKSFIEYIKLDDESLYADDIIYTDSEELEIGAGLDMGGIPVVLVDMSWIEGKGVIYRMIDEFKNDIPYDFKNIMFKRGIYINGQGIPKKEGYKDIDAYCYTFSWEDNINIMIDASIAGNNGYLLNDERQIAGVYGNVIKPYIDYTVEVENPRNIYQYLNNIVFLSNYSFEVMCYYGCHLNTFGNNCHNNSFGNNCHNNSFGNNCHNNSFGNNCYSNSFGNNCYSNSFEDNEKLAHNVEYCIFEDNVFNMTVSINKYENDYSYIRYLHIYKGVYGIEIYPICDVNHETNYARKSNGETVQFVLAELKNS